MSIFALTFQNVSDFDIISIICLNTQLIAFHRCFPISMSLIVRERWVKQKKKKMKLKNWQTCALQTPLDYAHAYGSNKCIQFLTRCKVRRSIFLFFWKNYSFHLWIQLFLFVLFDSGVNCLSIFGRWRHWCMNHTFNGCLEKSLKMWLLWFVRSH